ncbi:MAG: hypothetical protein ACRD26_17395 [Vicinamibacterales bacterium]
MAEVLLALDFPATDESGTYRPRVVGRRAEDGMWEGWLEFQPVDGVRETLVGPVESRQPEREHLAYWATGLTPVYVEGALRRARRPLTIRTRIVEEPVSDAPAPRPVVMSTQRGFRREAVLDPFEVARQSGLELLAQELRALNRPRLLNIVAEFDLNPGGEHIAWMSDAQLVRFIVVAVEAQSIQHQELRVRHHE